MRRQGMFGNQINRMKSSSKAIKRLIIINIIVFIVANIIISTGNEGFFNNVALSTNGWEVLSKPWTLITNMFMHLDFMHILFNMLYLWWFGKVLRESYGGQAVVSAYIVGGLVCSLFVISLYGSLISSDSVGYAIGASGGVMAIMVAAATINPNKIMNLFLIGAVRIKWVVLVLFILSTVLDINQNTGGKIGHFGGAFFGLLYGYNLRNGKNITARFDRLMSWFARLFGIQTSSSINGKSYAFRGAMDRRPASVRETSARNSVTKTQAKKEMDSLLDKVKRRGYEKLSKAEKERMKELTKYY